MGMININLEISKKAADIKLEDTTGTLTIEAALKQAQRNFNRVDGIHQIIKALRGDDND